jgi:predicted  nucleic acid-binding Zn-ribbon protein
VPTPTDKLKKLKEQQAKLKAKIQLEKNRISSQERKKDTRRKIITGALALTHADQHPQSDFAKQLNALIAEHVTKDQDRALFGLDPLPETPEGEHTEGQENTA